MMMLIVDTNILVGELLRERGQELIQNPALTLYATERILDETQYELRRRMTAGSAVVGTRLRTVGATFGRLVVSSLSAGRSIG